MDDYFDLNDTISPEITDALAALPTPARNYLIDLISITLGEATVPDQWMAEWILVRTAIGGAPTPVPDVVDIPEQHSLT